MLAAETEDRNSDRNADESTEETPQKCPQEGREQHERGRNRQHIARDTWLNVTAYHELNDVEADEKRQNLLPAVELRHRQQCRKQRCNKRADERDIVQREGDHS